MNLRRCPCRSSCQPAINPCSSFGRSRCRSPSPACFHFQTIPRKCRRSRRCRGLDYESSTLAIFFTSLPLSLVFVTSCHLQLSVPLLQVVSPLTVIDITIRVFIYSVLISFSVFPGAFVAVPIGVVDDPVSVFFVVEPFSLVFSP